jgi:hypothetical protein
MKSHQQQKGKGEDALINAAGLLIEPPSDGSPLYKSQMSTDSIEHDKHEYEPPPEINIIAESFSDMVTEHPTDRRIPLIVLDSANIGWNYGDTAFNALGVQSAVEYFQQFNVEIKAFIPASYVQKKPTDGSKINALMETDELTILKSLVRQKILTMVPSGDSDDAYIINYARTYSGFIITNDFFQDHLNSLEENTMKLSLKLWLSENRVSYTFVSGQQFLINPNSLLAHRLESLKEKEESVGRNRLSAAVSSPSSSSSSSSALLRANRAVHSLSKVISEFLVLQRYGDLKQLLLMKAKLLFDVRNLFEFV